VHYQVFIYIYIYPDWEAHIAPTPPPVEGRPLRSKVREKAEGRQGRKGEEGRGERWQERRGKGRGNSRPWQLKFDKSNPEIFAPCLPFSVTNILPVNNSFL
jgi:hypothetical protein